MSVGIDDDAVINNIILTDQGSNPATPGAGKTRIFTKSDGLYVIDDDAASSQVTLWSAILASQLVNEVKGWPPIVNTGSLSTLGLWWDDVGTVSVGAAVIPVASEGITENYAQAMKIVASTGSSGVYQRYTYANEPRVKSGRKLSALVAIWSVGGASITAKLVNSDASSTSATAVTTAAWNIVEIPNHTLAGTYCDLQITVAAAGTFYVVPLGVNIGTRGVPLRPRGGIYKSANGALVTAVDPGGADWTDVDTTTVTSNLAYMVQLHGLYYNATNEQSSLSIRRNGSTEGPALGNELCRSGTTAHAVLVAGIGVFNCDDGQIVEYKTNRPAGDNENVYINSMGWWEWE